MLKLENVSKSYFKDNKNVEILNNINVEINKGEFVSIIGPSGSGKSTLLRLISGLEEFDNGSINFDLESDKSIGFVFQDSVLLPWKTVFENVLLPFKIQNNVNDETISKVKEMIRSVNLEDNLNSFPNELSGGMKQRVSIARTLVYNPTLLLMDEPFGALDAITREELNKMLYRIHLENPDLTILFVTHDIEEAVYLSDRILVLSKNPAKIKSDYHIEFNSKERTSDIKSSEEFMGYVSMLREELK